MYKGVCLYIYDTDKILSGEYESISITGTKTISTLRIPEEEYLTFNNIKIRNDFKAFKIHEELMNDENGIKYALYNDANEIIAAFWMGVTDFTLVETFAADVSVYGDLNFYLSQSKRQNILKKNNIKNDIQLLNYLLENKNIKNNIFTSISRMQENFTLQYFTLISVPSRSNLIIIDGDYTGYIYSSDIYKECNILFNDKRYYFTFLKLDYFTDEIIDELLNTIVIEEL